MFVLMFTRLTGGTDEAIFLDGTFETMAEAQDKMRKEWSNRIDNMGWDADYSNIYDNQAFCGTEDMYDTCRYYIFDTDNPHGFDNSLNYEAFDEED